MKKSNGKKDPKQSSHLSPLGSEIAAGKDVTVKQSPTVEPTRLVVQEEYRELYRTPVPTETNASNMGKDLLDLGLFPIRLLLVPITVPIGLLVTRFLSSNRENADGTKHFLPKQSKPSEGQWEHLHIFAHEKAKPIEVNAFKLPTENSSTPKKLNINVHGAGGNANQYDHVTVSNAKEYQADQWNITRNPSWTVADQKRQLRIIIAAAIQQGYQDIRLDGYSYGAGLVLTVYHELMQDETYREKLKRNNVTLHYTARNGYQSEGLVAIGMLMGYGNKKDELTCELKMIK